MKKDRHTKVEVVCEICQIPFVARKERVDQGMGKYCSRECSHEGRRIEERKKWGRKDLARCYKIGGRYCARWYGENGEVLSTSYSRWWWEMNVGEIPEGMIVLLKDNDPTNIDPSNFRLGTRPESTNKARETLKSTSEKWFSAIEKRRQKIIGKKLSLETRKKMSDSMKGKKLSKEHRFSIGLRTAKMWAEGKFDGVHKGSNNWKWKGGVERRYPPEFNNQLRDFIKSRDNYMCQVCSRDLYKSRNAQVHHRDGNKFYNDQNNLILLCKSCHGKVHSKSTQSPPIMALREELL